MCAQAVLVKGSARCLGQGLVHLLLVAQGHVHMLPEGSWIGARAVASREVTDPEGLG